MSALGEVLGALAPILDADTDGWFVFGAQAVAVRGAPRATQDVDITVFLKKDRVEGLLKRMEPKGFQHRFPELAEELLESGSVVPLAHTPTGMEVDLVLAGSGLEDLTLSRATRIRVEGVDVPFAHATDLVVMKVLAGRGKDLEDVHSLLASGAVNLNEALDLLGQLESALDLPDLVRTLQSAMDEVEVER